MCKAAMMSELHNRALESPEDIQVGRFGCQSHSRGGQRRFAIESRPRKNCAGQKMSDGFQVKFVTQVETMWRKPVKTGHVETAALVSPNRPCRLIHRMIFRHQYCQSVRYK